MGQVMTSNFRPAWWLSNAHLQTIGPSLWRQRPAMKLRHWRVELADGDFIDLACGAPGGPPVVLIHGLEGTLDSHYATTLMQRLQAHGYEPIFMHLRGCSHEPNRLDRSYHSGASEDLAEVLEALRARRHGPLAAVGVSLGANLLLKYLGERDRTPLTGAVAISPPFDLRDCMLRIQLGASRIYRGYLMRSLRRSLRRKFATRPSPLEITPGMLRDFNAFDEHVTAPLNGFTGVYDYYRRASCRPFLRNIATPTLILHALDDPMMFPTTVPWASELGPGVTLELSRHGGHVGFVSGRWPWRPEYWLETRVLDWLERHLTSVRGADG